MQPGNLRDGPGPVVIKDLQDLLTSCLEPALRLNNTRTSSQLNCQGMHFSQHHLQSVLRPTLSGSQLGWYRFKPGWALIVRVQHIDNILSYRQCIVTCFIGPQLPCRLSEMCCSPFCPLPGS